MRVGFRREIRSREEFVDAAASRIKAQNSAILPSAFKRYISTLCWSKRFPSRVWFQWARANPSGFAVKIPKWSTRLSP